jgi:translocation and assembly module TamB
LRKTYVTLFAVASLGVLLGLTAILASVVGKEISLRMAELKSQTIAELEAVLGHHVTYASISPSFLNYLEIRDLNIQDEANPAKPLLTIHRVRIYYSLVHLLARHDPVGSLREIRILNTRFVLDLQKDRSAVELIQKLTAPGAADSGLRARITGADVDIVLIMGDTTLTISRLFFELNAQDSELQASFRGQCRGTLPSGFDFSTVVDVSGKIDRAFTSSDLTVRLLSFESSLFELEKQTLQVVWKGNQIQVQKIQDRSPIELGLVADLDSKEVTVSFQTDGLRPEELVRFSHGMARFNGLLKAPTTAAGRMTYDIPTGRLAYQVGISSWFQDQLPFPSVTLDASFTGTEKGASFSPLRLSSPEGTIQFDGGIAYKDFFPEGILTLTNVDAGTGKRVSADLTVLRENGGLAVSGRRLRIGEVGFEDFSLHLDPGEKGTAFRIESSFADTATGHISANGELQLRKPIRSAFSGGTTGGSWEPGIKLTASLRDVPPDKLYHLLVGAGPLSKPQEDIRSMLAGFTVTADVDLSTDLSTVTASSRQVTVRAKNDPSTAFQFSASVDPSHISVNYLTGTWQGYPLAGSFLASFTQDSQMDFSSDLAIMGTPFSLKGRYSAATGFYATGSYGIEVSVAPNRAGTYVIHAKASRLPVPYGRSSIAVSFDANGLYSAPEEWVVRLPSFTVFNMPLLESKRNAIGFTARITPKRIELGRVTFTDPYSSLAGSMQASLEMPPDPFDPAFLAGFVAQFSGELKDRSGAETYTAQGALRNGTLGITIGFSGVPLERLRSLSLRGTVSGTGTINGPVARPAVALHVVLNDGRLGTDPIAMETQAVLGRDSVQLSALKIVYLAHGLSDGAGTVDFRKGAFSLSGRYTGEYFSDHVQLAALLEGQFTVPPAAPPASPGASSAADGLLDLGLQGRLSLTDIVVEGRPFSPWGVTFRTQRGRLTIDGGPGNSLHGSIDSHLAFAIHLARPLPFVGDAGGRIVGDRIVASATVETFDATVLNSILKTAPITTQAGTFPVLSFTSGSARGRLSISGPVNDPDFTGELSVIGCTVRTAYSPDDAGPIATKLVFSGKEFHFSGVVANAGQSRLGADASFTIDHWAPSAFNLTLRTQEDTATHLRVKFGRMIADGHLQGILQIQGDDARTSVTGSILVTDCRITLGQAPQGAFVPEAPPTFLTLTVETGKRVEFAWPSESLPVVRTTASPGGKVVITYRGDTGAYTVKGSAAIQGGEIYYFDRSFILRKGAITFNEDQNSFDPRITARAEVREWDPTSGEEVRIYLDADDPLSQFNPRFSSDPPRPENYLLAMIGAPLVARAESQGLGLSAALISSDIVSQAWLLRPLENRLRDALGLDMVSVRTQIIQNLLAQKIFGTTLNPLDNTSISLGKYVGNDLFLEALLRLQAQPVPGSAGLSTYAPGGGSGVGLPPIPSATLPTAGIGLTPQFEWSMEWNTPFFTLDWVFQPQHPETLFLTDNALSFSWRFSY